MEEARGTAYVTGERSGIMMHEERKELNWENLSPDDRLKYEIADELGLLPQVKEHGWKSLSAKDTGRIGGLVTKRKRELNREA